MNRELMILRNENIIREFSKYFNARLNVIDFISKTRQFNNPKFDMELRNEYHLVVLNKPLFKKIKESGYSSFIGSIIKNIRIENEFRDVFESQLEKDLLEDVWEPILKNQIDKIEIELDEANLTFRVIGYDLIIDLFAQPLTELHHEVVEIFAQFHEINENMSKSGGNISNIFLNPNSSSAFSNFLQLYVAECFEMNINGHDGVIVT